MIMAAVECYCGHATVIELPVMCVDTDGEWTFGAYVTDNAVLVLGVTVVPGQVTSLNGVTVVSDATSCNRNPV